jgi:hypothetical protein
MHEAFAEKNVVISNSVNKYEKINFLSKLSYRFPLGTILNTLLPLV